MFVCTSLRNQPFKIVTSFKVEVLNDLLTHNLKVYIQRNNLLSYQVEISLIKEQNVMSNDIHEGKYFSMKNMYMPLQRT